MRDIQRVLEHWGAWAADDGIKIDAAIRRLKHYNSYYHQLIHLHYFKRQPERTIANRLGISRTTLIKRLQSAEGFVEGCLAMADITLEMDKFVQKENIYER